MNENKLPKSRRPSIDWSEVGLNILLCALIAMCIAGVFALVMCGVMMIRTM